MCKIKIGPDFKSDRQCIATIGSAGRLHVKHVFDTVDLLLDRKSDCLHESLCVRTRVVGGDLNSWRSDRRILRYRQIVERYSAEQHDNEGEHIRENGAFDEKSREHGFCIPIWQSSALR